MVSTDLQVNISGEHKTPQSPSHKWRQIFAEVRPNSHMLPSRTQPNIWSNFGVRRTSAHF